MFLNLRRLPATIHAEEVGWLLGMSFQEVSILVSKKCIKPLGNPAVNARKRFSCLATLSLGEDEKWKNDALKVLAAYWRERNQTTSKT